MTGAHHDDDPNSRSTGGASSPGASQSPAAGSSGSGPYGSSPYGSGPYGSGSGPAYGSGPQPTYGPGPYPAYAPGPYPGTGYGYGGPPYQRRGGGMATAALVLGILALLSCWTILGGFVLGLIAVVLGAVAWRRARRGEAEGQGRAVAGLVTGGLGIVLAGGLLAIGISIFNSPTFQNYRDCLQNSNGDRAAVEQCQRQFQDQYSN